MSTGLSPNDIRNYEFPHQMRGYDKDEVREFLEQIAVALEDLKQDNLKVSMERDSLRTQLDALKQFEDTIKSAAIDARRNADTLVANAKREVAEILDKARREAELTVGSRKDEAALLDEQITKLQMTKASYQAKLKHLIESHLELVDEVQRLKAPAMPAPIATRTESSLDDTQPPTKLSKIAAASTAITPPTHHWAAAAQAETDFAFDSKPITGPAGFTPAPANLADGIHPNQGGAEDFFGESFSRPTPPKSLSSTNGIVVEETTEVTRKKLETFSTEPEPPEPERTEEANAAERIVAVTAVPNHIPQKSAIPIDSELAAALESYQRAHGSAPELSKTAPAVMPSLTPAATPEQPDQSMRAIPTDFADRQSTANLRTQAVTDEPDNTEHNLIDIDQPIGAEKPQRILRPGTPETDSIARELDEVAARFEEEMDRAAKS